MGQSEVLIDDAVDMLTRRLEKCLTLTNNIPQFLDKNAQGKIMQKVPKKIETFGRKLIV